MAFKTLQDSMSQRAESIGNLSKHVKNTNSDNYTGKEELLDCYITWAPDDTGK
jgi:hypothetical protein